MSDLIKVNTQLAGYFKIEATQPDGSKRVVADWFPNLITDIGLEQWGSGGIITFCRLGTSTNAPAVTDTALFGQLASVAHPGGNSTAVATNPGTGFIAYTYTFAFAQGVTAGNLSEIGVGWGSTGSTLFSRSRIKDGVGADTTVTILAIDQLTVTYQLRIYPAISDVNQSITISGVNYTIVTRAARVNGLWGHKELYNGNPWAPSTYFGQSVEEIVELPFVSGGVLGATTGIPTGAVIGINKPVRGAYSASTRYIDTTFSLGPNNGNVSGGIKALFVPLIPGEWQFSFAPGIAKDNTKTLSLTIRLAWARRP